MGLISGQRKAERSFETEKTTANSGFELSHLACVPPRECQHDMEQLGFILQYTFVHRGPRLLRVGA
jgi:hypothetical protein